MAFGFDPTYSAFLRSMGVDEQDIYAQTRQQNLLAENSYARQVPVFEESARAAVQNVQNDAEARGVLASNITGQNADIARNNVLRQQAIAQGSMLDQQAQTNLDAAGRVAALRRQQTEQELAARTRLTEGNAKTVYGG